MTALQTPQALIEQITSAFAHVNRQDSVTLHQAIALDNYESREAIAAARFQDTDTHWSEIRRETLVNFESALPFLNAQGTRYYLPAFMIAALEGHIDPLIPFFTITNFLGSLRKSSPGPVVAVYRFDPQQSLAIANFLRFVVGDQGENAESQAVLQLVWEWEDFANHGTDKLEFKP